MIRTTWLDTLLIGLKACELSAETPEEMKIIQDAMETVKENIKEKE